ncbi:MAG: VCBS repeat-containing protein [Krumholzibacteria bacterium]|nr:VCBS repeat-containing protein [Candidatus Krumholzibacteria bacterium]
MPAVMLRSAALILALALAAALAAPAAAAPGAVIHEGTFSAADLGWETFADGSVRPLLGGTRHLALPGAPDLPVAELLLLIPADRTVASVTVEALATRRLALPGSLATAAPAVFADGAVVPVAPDAGSTKAAAAWGEATGTHRWRGYRLLSVQVRPVRPVEGSPGEAEFLEAYTVRVAWGGAAGDQDMVRRLRRVPGEAERNAQVLTAVVANREAVGGYARDHGTVVDEAAKGFIPTPLPSLTGSAVSYVIITDQAMAPEFQRLADHKTARGLPTVVVTRAFIAANYRNGADIQETMRMFIRDAYERWGTEFVLMGGDSDVLPPRYVNNSLYPAGGSTDIPVELYFQCLDGNWNANGNGRYGEPGSTNVVSDEADFAEEVYLGRAPVSTPQAAAVFVDKVIAYERAAAGAGWPNRVLFAAEVLFPDPWSPGDGISLDGSDYPQQQVNNSIIPCTDMEYLRMYETFDRNVGDVLLNKQVFTNALNTAQYGIVNQIGHGYYYNMSLGSTNFINSDADALVNGDHVFMLYALNCASAAFDYSCLMERFLQNPNGGAVSAIGAVRAAFPVTSNNYQQQFFSQLYCQPEHRQGALVALSRLPWLGATNLNYTDRWTFENYTLLGDPTMSLWTDSPAALVLGRPASLGLGPQTVNVTVTSGGAPVAGARVCLAKDGEDWAVGLTDAGGQVSLDFLPVSTGQADLTVSGVNLAHTTAAIPVVAGGSYLAVTGVTVIDNGALGSTGNGNGQPEAGETVALVALLQETGGAGASGISGTMSVSVPGVTVTVPAAAFPNVTAGGAVVSTTPFVFSVAPDVPDGTPVTFSFEVTDGLGVDHSEWETRILAPELEVVAIDWEDATWGNGDGLLSGGERIGVTFRAKNFGAGRADAITAYLRTDDGNVVLHDTLAVVPPLESMDEASGSTLFSQTLLTASRRSLSRIVLVDNYGRTVSRSFYPHRPEPPTVITTDATQGADIIALTWDQSPSGDVVGYDVYRSLSAGGPWVKANRDLILATTYFRDEGLDLLTRYYYRVAAVDSVLVPSEPTAVFSQSTAPPELAAFPLGFGAETSSHLAVGDVDGDGDFEIVLASDEVYVWHHDGGELVDGDANSQTLGPMTDLNTVLQPAGVVLAHLDQVPGLEMIISERGNTKAIHVFNRDGQELPGWPQTLTTMPGDQWNWATPAVGDIDGDGDPEIVVCTLNGVVWAWHADGTEVRDGDNNAATNGVFYVRAGATWEFSMSGPALEDLDGDGAKDIVFGTRNDSTGQRRVMALRYDGSNVAGFPYVVSGPVLCHPAIGDLDNDGLQEIVVYTTWGSLYAIRQDGTNLPGFPASLTTSVGTTWATSPALGDVDGDGDLEIVIAANTAGTASRLLVFDTTGANAGKLKTGWPQHLPGSSEGSPVLGDINGDGQVDIIHGIGGGDSTAPNNLYAFNADGTPIDGFPIALGGPVMPSVTICDLDADGDVDLVYGGWDRLIHVWDMPFAYDQTKVPWMTFQNNMQRTGVFFPIELMGVGDEPGDVPAAGFSMASPFPNPFNPSTSVRLYVPREGDLRLVVHDVRGHLVRTVHDGPIGAGWHVMTWDGRDDGGRAQASGMYFMRAHADQAVSIHKMTLVK